MPLCEMKADKSAYSVFVSLEGYGLCSKSEWPEPYPVWNAPAFLARRETRRPESPTLMLQARLRWDLHLFPSPRPCPMLPRACHAVTMGTTSLPAASPGPQTYSPLC